MRALFLALLAATCDPQPTPPQPVPVLPPPSWELDAAPEAAAPGPRACALDCAHLEAIGCAAAASTPGPDGTMGTSDDGACEAVCENIDDSGTLTYPHACVRAAPTCADVDACFR